MHRRSFLGASVAGSVAAVGRGAAPRVALGLDSYTLRSFRWKSMQLLDYAAARKLDALQFSLNDMESPEPAHLAALKDKAAKVGIAIEVGIGCICPTTASWNPKMRDPASYLLEGMAAAKAIGSKAMRCFMGSPAERRRPLPMEAHMEATIKALRSVRSQALDLGIKIALENHGDLEAGEMKTVLEEAGPDYAGCCFDSGNPMSVLEDPLFTLGVLAPYVVTSHFRDSALYEHPRGAAFQWVALGDGSTGLMNLVGRFGMVCPNVPMHLEILTGRPPQVLPYLETDFWNAFPKKSAAGFARFVALAKSGQPFMGPMVVGGANPSAAVGEALKEQQRTDFERSVDYARRSLGVGLRA